MEEPGPAVLKNGTDGEALGVLIDAFCPIFTQKELGSACSEARENADAAGHYVQCVPNVGTVSSSMDKDYGKLKPLSKSFPKATKSLKVGPETLPASALWVKKDSVEKKDRMHNEMGSAYSEARENADEAGHCVRCVTNGDDLSSKLSFHDMSLEPIQSNEDSKSSNLYPSASVGTVLSSVDKNYVRLKPLVKPEATKSLKLGTDTLPESALWVKKDSLEKKDRTHNEMGSAYSEVRENADAADPNVRCVPNGDDLSSKSSFHDVSMEPGQSNEDSKSSNLKCPTASVGMVSSSIDKYYVRSKPSAKRLPEATESLQLGPETLPLSALWVRKDSVEKKDRMHNEMGDFLFKMLGEGFQLDRKTIEEVLGTCGYDMQKSMEKLFDYSASAMDKKMTIHQESIKCTGSYSRAGTIPQQKMVRPSASLGRRVASTSKEDTQRKFDKDNLQKEVLAALFSYERPEDLHSSIAVKKPAASFLAVESSENSGDSLEKLSTVNEYIANSKQDNYEDDEDGSYQALRKAVQEYRSTMKEYYTAAIEAFQAGDKVRAYKLIEKGSFFQKKAREADDASAEKIFETSYSKNKDTEDSMTLNLHEYEPRDAIRLLKNHLSSLAGSSAFKYLKVVIETADGDTSKGACRRRIMKLLEGDTLEWVEEGTAGTILIPLESINRRRLSFVKK